MSAYFIEKDHRAKIASVLLIIALMVIIAGLFYHQIIRYKSFLAQSEENRIRIRPIIPKRGVIFDRNMEMIADNRLSFTVSIVPMEMEKDVTLPRLAELTGADTLEIKKKLNANFISKYIPAAVLRDQDIGVISTLEENGEHFPGATYSVESVRQYVEGISAETFIGYIAEVAPDEIDNESQWGYRPGRLIGKKGIEKAYDRELRGIEGTDFIEVSARGQIIGPYGGKDRVPAVPGADLVLTIDAALQREIVKFYDSLQASGGVVALDPTTGEILALASFPGLDPNLFSGVIPDEIWRSIIDDPRHPLLNRPTSSMYPPGSTAKLLTAGAALERGVLTPETILRGCGGGMRFGNRVFKCWQEQGHGRLDLYHAVEQSCNVYFYQVGQILGLDAWNEFAVKCGFGKKSGIDISGELSGIAPSRPYYDKAFGPNRWSKLLILNIAIGQGEFIVTPLQLTQFYAGLANGGKVFKPHLLKEIRYPERSVQKIEPTLSFTLPFSQNTLSVLSRALELVVQGERGTAKGLRNKYYTIAGKTGTAQNPHGKDHSWFVGYAPSNAPRILVCALVENAGHGSEVAAPLAGRIIKRYLLGDSTQNVIAQSVAESPVTE